MKNQFLSLLRAFVCGVMVLAGAASCEKMNVEGSEDASGPANVVLRVGSIEQVLFPAVRKAVAENPEVIIAAPGTSCREQIKHGTGRTAYHPIEVMYSCLAV